MRTQAPMLLLCATLGCGGAPFSAADPAESGEAGKDDAAPVQPADAPKGPDAFAVVHDASGDAGAPEATTDAGTLPEAGDAPEAAVDAAPDGGPTCPCVDDLSGIGLGDFTISFTLKTNSTTPMAILNQRDHCDTTHPYWDVHTGSNGAFSPNEGVVYIEVDNGSGVFDDVSTERTVNDGQAHAIVIERTQGGTYFTLSVDGVGGAQGIAPLDPLTGGLPPLATGTDVCASNGPIAAELTGICIQRCGR